MVRAFFSLLCLVPSLLAAPAAAGETVSERALWRENRRLAVEVELAQKTKPYFVLDLAERRIAVKARGMTLQELPVERAMLWGRRLSTRQAALVGKDSLAQHVRPEIRPGEEKTPESLDEQILEVSDMPASYHLVLDGEVDIEVRPTAEPGFWPQVRQRGLIWRWQVSHALQTLRERRERRSSTGVYLLLRPDDARHLYWSFFEGIEGVIVPP